MNNQVNYQQIHNFHLNLQGIQPQKLQGQIQVLSPKTNYASPPQYLIQSINHAGIQINQGVENSPSNRFLSNTAKVLKSQTIDFKQMMVKQHQQNLANHNYPNRQIIEVKKNQNEGVQIQPQQYQKPATPTAMSSSPSQGFAQTYQHYQRSNSASYAVQQNGIQYDQRVQQPIFVKYITSDNAQNSLVEQNIKSNTAQSSSPSSLPLSPTQIKQKQKCMTYVVQQNNQHQVFGLIERRRSVEEKANAQEIQKAIVRFSDSFRHKFSDSIQSNNTTANPITTTAVSVKSNYSPLQQFDSIDNNKNTTNNLINNSLQLEGSEQNNQNIQFIQEQHTAKHSFRSNQQVNNNEEIMEIDNYQLGSSHNSEEGSKTQRINETPQDLNNNITNIMNLYYFKNQSDVIDNQNSSREQEMVQNHHQVNQDSQKTNFKKNNSFNDSRIKAQQDYLLTSEETQNQVSLSQKSSPQSQASRIKGNQNQNNQFQKSRKSLSGVYLSKSKTNQASDDKLSSNSQSANKNANKTNQKSQKFSSKINNDQQKYQKKQQYQSNDKIGNNQKLLKQNSRSSSTQLINVAPQSQKHFQLYENDSSNKKAVQKTYQHNDNQMVKQNQIKSQKNSIQQTYNQQQNNSSHRQITFPESPISITNQIDSSCGFGSEITYTEDQISECSNRILKMKGNNPIPLIVNHNQICYDLSHLPQKNKSNGQFESIQNKDQQNHLLNEKNFKKKEQTKGSPYNLQQKIDQQNYVEDNIFSMNAEKKLLTENKDVEESKQLKNSIQYDEDDDQEANPDFINLYKTPAKPNSCNLKEAQYTNQIQNLKDKSFSAGQVLDLRKNSSQNEQQQQESSKQENQVSTEARAYQNNNINAIQNKLQDQENNEKIEQIQDKENIESLKEFDNNNGDESPFIAEMKKQHQKIIEEFSIKPIFALDSKEDLNKFSKESSQNSSDAKYSHVSKSDIKKQKRDIESVQSINELLNFMGGIQQSSNTDFIVPGSSVSKQNLSQIFDENSNLPSNVCSLQMIQEQQMIEQVKNIQKQQIQNKQMKDLKANQKGTNHTNQSNSKHMSHIQTKLTAHQKNFIAAQQKQQKKSSTTYKRQDSPNQVLIQLKGSNSQTQGIKIQDLYVGQYSSKSLHQQKELKGEATSNSQQLQKQRTQERKSSLVKPESAGTNQNKNQNVINLQRLAQHTQQLEKIVQSAGNNVISLGQESKFSNSSSKETLRQSNNSQKMAKKMDNKSTNSLTKNNSLTMTQDTSNVNQNNLNSIYSTQQTFLKKSTSNTQKQSNQNNYINFINKSSDGGHIIMYQINSKKQ
ncbi:hypothetical protein ABPG74_007310 [Tetrahymena malaccensis]